jgi:hypothetical protein
MAAITTAVVSAGVGAYSAYNSKKQGDKMAGIAGSQNQRQQYFADQLIDLMQNPNKIFEDAGYQASFDQGMQAVERSSSAQGFAGSGNAAVALQRFGQSFSSTYLQQQKNLLASLSGAQFNPASAGQVAQGSYDASYQQLGGALSSLGYAFGGSGGSVGGVAGGVGGSGSFGSSTSIPGTMHAGGGYMVNVPGE